eukprot:PRCOL_00001225-RA
MQALARPQTTVRAAAAAPAARRARAAALAPAQVKDAAVKLSSAAVGMAAAVTASPAYAVIEERMGGEGAGAYGRLPLGINDPILGFVLGGVVVTVWGLYLSQGGNVGYDDEDSGLDL